ncbi:MAG: hypothetical protein WD873_08340 [Candidatus Hydrogenedentales bacterium]
MCSIGPKLLARNDNGAFLNDRVAGRRGFFPVGALCMGGDLPRLCTMTIVVHQTRMLVDMGYGLTLASLIFGILGVLRAFGRYGSYAGVSRGGASVALWDATRRRGMA